MAFNPDIHKRRSIRLAGYDYSQAGLYFLTICVQDKECLFGSIENGAMILNEYGRMAEDEWLKSAKIRLEIELHGFIVMPNHIHGIVEIVEGIRRGDWPVAPVPCSHVQVNKGDLPVAPTGINGPKPKSIGAFVGGYKASVTKRINALRETPGLPVWQRNYYEHIIRNAESYDKIAAYITTNPAQWQDDRFCKLQ